MNMEIKPMAYSIGDARFSLPPQIVAIQLKILMLVGTAMIMLSMEKTASATGFMPTANI
jgi:hypothetical protein